MFIRWCHNNKKYYESKGYIFTYWGDTFEIKIEDITRGSSSLIKYNCDYCNKIIESSYNGYFKRNKNSVLKKDSCKSCTGKKVKKTNDFLNINNSDRINIKVNKMKQTSIKKYGVENYAQTEESKEKMKKTNLKNHGVEYYTQTEECKEKTKQTNLNNCGTEHVFQSENFKEKKKQTCLKRYGKVYIFQSENFKEKSKQTCLKRYGFKYACQSKEIKEKICQTNLERHGVENPMQLEKFKEKRRQTNLKTYGVECVFQCEKVKEKSRQTCLKNHGIEYGMQSEEIRQKRSETLYKNGNGPSSKPQDYLCELLIGRNNYPVRGYSLDIAFPDELLDIEYNGGGHYVHNNLEEINKNDIIRKRCLMSQGVENNNNYI